jgi:hypothetical protein
MAKAVDVDSEEANLLNLISLLTVHSEIVLTKDEKPIAILHTIASPEQLSSLLPRTAGLHPGAIQTSKDFDQPLLDE